MRRDILIDAIDINISARSNQILIHIILCNILYLILWIEHFPKLILTYNTCFGKVINETYLPSKLDQ